MGAGGMLVPQEDYFPKVQAVLRKHDILMLSTRWSAASGDPATIFPVPRRSGLRS